jgi:hypothetical protein
VVSLIHNGSDTAAVHPHVGPAETLTLPVAPLNGALLEGGVIEYSHGCGGATVNVIGTASLRFAVGVDAAASTPTYVPGVSPAVLMVTGRDVDVVPPAAPSESCGTPRIAALNGSAPDVVLNETGVVGAGAPITW